MSNFIIETKNDMFDSASAYRTIISKEKNDNKKTIALTEKELKKLEKTFE